MAVEGPGAIRRLRGRAAVALAGERRWYEAPYRGDRAPRANDGLSHSPIYDPQLRLLVRFTHATREQWVETFVMRLDPATLAMRPLAEAGAGGRHDP